MRFCLRLTQLTDWRYFFLFFLSLFLKYIGAETFHDVDLLELVHLVVTRSKDGPCPHAAAIKADCPVSRADVLESVAEGLRLHSSATTSLWLTVLEAEWEYQVDGDAKEGDGGI